MQTSIHQINAEYYKTCFFVDIFQKGIDELDRHQAKEKSILKSPSAFFSMIKKTCKEVAYEERPYGHTILYIAVLISVLSHKEQAKNYSLEALKTYHMIFNHINTALTDSSFKPMR
jgi:hypothetical protein